MDAYLVALFLHLLVVGLAFCAIALIHFHLWQVRRAEQVADARRSIGTMRKSQPRTAKSAG